MPDNVISIGAVVDAAQLKSGMEDTRAAVKKSLDEMGTSFQGLSTRTKNAMQGISADVLAASKNVSEESLRVVESTRAQWQAMADLRRANTLARDSNLSVADTTAILAAAQEKAAAAAEALAIAQVEAAEESEAGWMGMAASVKESLVGVQESIISTAEKAELSTDGIAAGFGGLGKLLGAGIAGEFIGHALDEVAEVNVKLGDMADTTNIAVQSLAGLQQITKEKGLTFEPIVKGLQRMSSAQFAAAHDSTHASAMQVEAFTSMGISMKEIETYTPEQMFYRLSTAIHDNTDVTKRNAAARAIFGRGASNLIPIFLEQGAALESEMKAQGKMTGMTQESVDAARQWTEATAKLAAGFHSLLIPVLEHILPVGQSIKYEFKVMGDSLAVYAFAAYQYVAGISSSIIDLGNAASDAAHGQWKQMTADAKEAGTDYRNISKSINEAIASDNKELLAEKAQIQWDPKAMAHAPAGATDLSGLAPAGKGHHSRGTGGEDREAREFERTIRGHSRVQEAMKKDAKGQEAEKNDALAALAEMQMATEGFAQKTADDLAHTGKAWKEYNAELVKGLKIEDAQKAALEAAQVKYERAEGRISALGAAQRMAGIHALEYAAQLKTLREELAQLEAQASKDALGNFTNPQQATKIQAVHNQISGVQGKQQVTGMQDKKAEADAFASPWIKAFGTINQSWLQVQTQLLMGTSNVGLMFRNMGAQMVATMAASLEQMLLKTMEHEFLMVVMHNQANEAKLASDSARSVRETAIHAATSARKLAIEAAEHVASITMEIVAAMKKMVIKASTAAASAFSATVGVAPPPFGEILAAGAAAGAFAGTMALAAFETGGIIPNTGIAMVHQGEAVLPRAMTEFVMSAAMNQPAGSSSSSSTSVNQTNHFHGSTDQQFRDAASRNAGHLFDTMQQHVRRTGGR